MAVKTDFSYNLVIQESEGGGGALIQEVQLFDTMATAVSTYSGDGTY